ncbi:UNVERIFIED_ORG: TolC family protein [Shinella sp. XGS7]|nr:TolC family protein [Shinella sp. XGS7]
MTLPMPTFTHTLAGLLLGALLQGAAMRALALPEVPDEAPAPPALRLEPEAEALIARGQANSPQLALALARLREARAQQRQSAAAGQPQLELQAQAGQSRGRSELEAAGGPRQRRQLQADFRWELDLLGRRQAEAQAGQAQAQAVEADLQAARLALGHALRGELLRLRGAELARLQREALLQTLQEQQTLEQSLLAQGLRSTLDQITLEAELTQRRAELAQSAEDARLAALRLERLSDIEAPQWLALAAGPLPRGEAEARPPLQRLAQRPDVRAAEARLRATRSEASAAQAALWPTLRLDAQLLRQRESGVLGAALRDSTERFLGLGLAWALLDGGQRRATREAAQARAEQAAAEFRRVVLEAAEEAQAALAQARALGQAQQQREAAQERLERAQALALQRERLGLDSRLERLRRERAAQEGALATQQLRSERLQAVLSVERALGRP